MRTVPDGIGSRLYVNALSPIRGVVSVDPESIILETFYLLLHRRQEKKNMAFNSLIVSILLGFAGGLLWLFSTSDSWQILIYLCAVSAVFGMLSQADLARLNLLVSQCEDYAYRHGYVVLIRQDTSIITRNDVSLELRDGLEPIV